VKAKEDMAMRLDYHKVFPGGVRAMAELERAVHSTALEPELLRSDIRSLDGLDLPDHGGPAGSA
jgi:hypothetical protein